MAVNVGILLNYFPFTKHLSQYQQSVVRAACYLTITNILQSRVMRTQHSALLGASRKW